MSHSTEEANNGKHNKLKDYLQLTKPALSIMVVFSSVICYLMAPNVGFDWLKILILAAGGYFVTGSANAINQAVEKDTDAQMKRTASRPVASGRMSAAEAWAFAVIVGGTGLFLLFWFFNWQSSLLAFISLFLYAFVYTPWKKRNAIAVLIGALPGALPCLIGWVAGTGMIDPFGSFLLSGDAEPVREVTNVGGWILFGLQFLWQFPHFWAIAWVAHGDYSRAGFRLLPGETGPTKMTALQTVIYSVLLIPVGLLPYLINMSGIVSLVVVLIANIFLVVQCLRLYRDMEVKSARRVMFSSYIYLPVVFLALLADKW